MFLFSDIQFRNDVHCSGLAPSKDPEDGTGGTRCCHYERTTADVRRSPTVTICRRDMQGSYEMEADHSPL